MSSHGSKRGKSGFTLLEVMVAFVIFASVGLTVFSWINTSLTGVQRVREANRKTAFTLNALELLASINPMEEPDGEIDCSGLILSWSAVPLVVPMRQGRGALYSLALYRVDVVVNGDEEHEEIRFSLVREGYRQVGKSGL